MNGRKRLIALDGNTGSETREENGPEVEEAAVEAGVSPEEMDREPMPQPPESQDFAEAWDEDDLPERSFGWVLPTLAILAVIGWTGFFGWTYQQDMLSGATPEQWIGWVRDWSIPVLLIVGLWLVAMRNSRREATRFGETARLLAAESAALETRLGVVNRELSLARDFIASQSRDLESLGRMASERLSENADRLQGLIRDNSEQVNAIGTVSDNAVTNMDKLRDQLPVISNAARDVASQIGNAGHTAQERLDQLTTGFERLNEFGQASELQVDGLREKVDATISTFEEQLSAIEKNADERFATLMQQSESFRVELESRETDTLAAIRRRAQTLGDELAASSAENAAREEELVAQMSERLAALREEGALLVGSMKEGQEEAETLWMRSIDQFRDAMKSAVQEVSRIDEAAIANARQRLEALSKSAEHVDASIMESANAFETEFNRRREQHQRQESEALANLESRLAQFDEQLASRHEEQLGHLASLGERGNELSRRLTEFDRILANLADQGSKESDRLGQAGELLAERLSQSRAILEESNQFVSRLTDDSVRLLEIIRSSAEHSEGALSSAIEKAESRLSGFREQAATLHQLVGEAEEKGEALAGHVGKASQDTAASSEAIEALEQRIAALAAQSETLARQSRSELEAAIATLEEASGIAIARIRTEQDEVVQEIAARIGTQGTEAIEHAIKEGAASAIVELEEAAANASAHGREAAAQLRDHLAKVNELASNLEQRVAQARAKAEEQVDSDFSRRMALITESLNSCSIDISKAFDMEVTDTAWAGYLRGDRGIFTRRAVRLIDNHDARAITSIYEDDAEFREAVNRYIHDFEGMLRTVLSTRDGNSLGVTLLSSDMGKLYVALAQAIERLRD